MQDPQWDDIRVFLAVARDESLSSAAKSLKIDPATVGRRVARLEVRLGANLFLKSPQGYALTPAGLRFLARAEEVEKAVLSATDDVQGTGNTLQGQIRLGAPDGCANFLLPSVCSAIARDHPGLDIQIVALPRVFNISKREADMAITVSPPKSGRLTVQRLTDYSLHLAASTDYLEKAPPLRSLEDLKSHRIIGYIPDLIFDTELDYLAEIGNPMTGFASNSVSVQINWARSGGGIVIAHDFALPFAPELKRLLSKEFALTRSFYLVRHADDRRIARFSRFAEELARRIPLELTRLEGLT